MSVECMLSMTLLSGDGGAHAVPLRRAGQAGKGFHSSTYQLRLHRFHRRNPATTEMYPSKSANVRPKSGRA